jgi:hypothetical protein
VIFHLLESEVNDLKKYSLEVVCKDPACPIGSHNINILVSLEDGPDTLMRVTDYFKEGEVPAKLKDISGNICVCPMSGISTRQKDYTQLVLNPDYTANTGKMREI